MRKKKSFGGEKKSQVETNITMPVEESDKK